MMILALLPSLALVPGLVTLGGRSAVSRHTAARRVAHPIANEVDLQDASKSVFDQEECLVDAENPAESAACREEPGEPFIYAGAPPDAELKGPPPLPRRGTSGIEECASPWDSNTRSPCACATAPRCSPSRAPPRVGIVEAEGYAEIADCNDTYSPGKRDRLAAPPGDAPFTIWRPLTNAFRALAGSKKK